MVDTIVCESTGRHTGICAEQATTKIVPTATQSKETVSEMNAGPNLSIVASAITSSVVATIAMILLSYLLIRRRQRRTKPGNDKPVSKVAYQDYVTEGTHEYATYNAVVQNQKTTADEVVYQKSINVDKSKGTGNQKGIANAMVRGQTLNHAVPKLFSHINAGRSQKVNSSLDYVDIPYKNTIRVPAIRGRVKQIEFQFSGDYSEIDACIPNENQSTEPNDYLQIIG
ncbi:uncharacterized protein LOC117107328 [Anneissia japonica]|uniref:uncharacterized protein LOC117107328 n=1 Tax=Anneissia japonica TaxID=1529436 RepID=UPI0014255F23|nr:uncharacterized protein LOC117107328 [Anneissia japonica]